MVDVIFENPELQDWQYKWEVQMKPVTPPTPRRHRPDTPVDLFQGIYDFSQEPKKVDPYAYLFKDYVPRETHQQREEPNKDTTADEECRGTCIVTVETTDATVVSDTVDDDNVNNTIRKDDIERPSGEVDKEIGRAGDNSSIIFIPTQEYCLYEDNVVLRGPEEPCNSEYDSVSLYSATPSLHSAVFYPDTWLYSSNSSLDKVWTAGARACAVRRKREVRHFMQAESEASRSADQSSKDYYKFVFEESKKKKLLQKLKQKRLKNSKA